ncbi:hypothetical protein BHE74_00023518, partial [Ensete ventricosum]
YFSPPVHHDHRFVATVLTWPSLVRTLVPMAEVDATFHLCVLSTTGRSATEERAGSLDPSSMEAAPQFLQCGYEPFRRSPLAPAAPQWRTLRRRSIRLRSRSPRSGVFAVATEPTTGGAASSSSSSSSSSASSPRSASVGSVYGAASNVSCRLGTLDSGSSVFFLNLLIECWLCWFLEKLEEVWQRVGGDQEGEEADGGGRAAGDADERTSRSNGVPAVNSNEALPLVYDPDIISSYWGKRPRAVSTRIIQLLSVAGGFLSHLAWDLINKKITENEVARAIELREIVTSLGPAYIKLGQALSIRPDILSPAAMTELQKLCDKVIWYFHAWFLKVPSFPDDAAMALIEEELGQPWYNVYSELTPSPIAAGNLIYTLQL